MALCARGVSASETHDRTRNATTHDGNRRRTRCVRRHTRTHHTHIILYICPCIQTARRDDTLRNPIPRHPSAGFFFFFFFYLFFFSYSFFLPLFFFFKYYHYNTAVAVATTHYHHNIILCNIRIPTKMYDIMLCHRWWWWWWLYRMSLTAGT